MQRVAQSPGHEDIFVNLFREIFGLKTMPLLLLCSACATGQAAGESTPPLPIRLPPEAPVSIRAVQGRIYHAALKQAHYLLGTVHPWTEDAALRLLTESKSGEHWVRPNTGAVEGFAFLHRFGPYDEKLVGVSRAELLSGTIVPMMRYLVVTHVTGSRATSDQKQWGDAWQSAHWAQMCWGAVHLHDAPATILSLLGLDHQKLTYLFQGREHRLTDMGGKNDAPARLIHA